MTTNLEIVTNLYIDNNTFSTSAISSHQYKWNTYQVISLQQLSFIISGILEGNSASHLNVGNVVKRFSFHQTLHLTFCEPL